MSKKATEKRTEKKAKAGVTGLSEKDLEKAQGGWSWGETNLDKSGKEKATSPKLQTDLPKLNTDETSIDWGSH